MGETGECFNPHLIKSKMEDFLEQEFGQMMAVEVVRDIIAAAEKQVIYNKVSHQLVSSVTQWTMDELICCVEVHIILLRYSICNRYL